MKMIKAPLFQTFIWTSFSFYSHEEYISSLDLVVLKAQAVLRLTPPLVETTFGSVGMRLEESGFRNLCSVEVLFKSLPKEVSWLGDKKSNRNVSRSLQKYMQK